MNKRQRKKLTISMIAKLTAKIKYPELYISSTRPEREVFRRTGVEKFNSYVKETLQNSTHI